MADAVMALFMSHYIFNLEYDKRLKFFYLFIQTRLAGIRTEGTLPPKVASLCSKIERAIN